MGEGLFEDDEPDIGAPPPAPDRIWRHPAEIGAEQAAANLAARQTHGRRWPAMLMSFIAGATAVGMVWLFSESPKRNIEVIQLNEIEPAAVVDVQGPIGFDDWAVEVSQPNFAAVVGLHLGGDIEESVAQGFLYRTDGHIITSAHAIEGATEITAVLSDGTGQPAQVVATDPVSGVAVLKVTSPEIEPVGFSTDSVARQDRLVGIAAHTAGSRSGRVQTVDLIDSEQVARLDDGQMLSGLYRLVSDLDASWAGAPIVDEKGGVVAMAVFTSDGTNHAVPAGRVRGVADDLIETGATPQQAWIGVQVAAGLSDDLMSERSLRGGALITRVWSGTPASDAGLRAGDVIVAYDVVPVVEKNDLLTALRAAQPGDVVEVQYSRLTAPDVPRLEVREADEYQPEIMTATVTLGAQPVR